MRQPELDDVRLSRSFARPPLLFVTLSLSPSAVCLFSSARDSWPHAHWLPPFTLTITLANRHSAWTASGLSFPDVHPVMPRLFSARISQGSQRRTQSVHQHTVRVQRLGGTSARTVVGSLHVDAQYLIRRTEWNLAQCTIPIDSSIRSASTSCTSVIRVGKCD